LRNPLEDDSRWALLGSRFETDGPLRQMVDEMFEEWVESLPPDNPARLLYYMLPKAAPPMVIRDQMTGEERLAWPDDV
jgi:hypothetical protein